MVSVVVPVYNAERFLVECVESIRSQTLSDIEIILVDDGSTDGSPQICDEYREKDERIQVIHQANGGSTKARNAGILASHGQYIGFVDSDDWIEPDMYEELLKCCVENRADMVASVKYHHHEKSHYRGVLGIPEGIYEKGDPGKVLIRNLIYREDFGARGISPNLYDKLFKRELLCENQLSVDERTKYGEDDVCVYSCLLQADRVVMVNQAYYHYRLREGSVCHSTDDMYFEEITWFYQQLKERFLKHPDADILMNQLKRYMLEFVLRGMNKYFGFGYGVVMPYFLPPFAELQRRGMQKIVLYGAGDVGQDYFRAFQLWGTGKIVLWIDRQYMDYRKKGLPVSHISSMEQAEYDGVLIAVENEGLADRIRSDLIGGGIPPEKIFYGKPYNMVQKIGEMG